jgi:hypothetical protein
MGCCYSKKAKEYDEILSTITEGMFEKIAKKVDMFAATYNGQSYIWEDDKVIDTRKLN